MANHHHQHTNKNYDNPQQPSFTASTGGKVPRQIHIAHRRSPSELTNLMIEQFALQRQLELVQQQQQQILASQQYSNNNNNNNNSNNNNNNNSTSSISSQLQPPHLSHKRTGSNSHRRSQSSITGAMGSFSLSSNLAPPPPLQKQSNQNHVQGHNRRHSLGLNEAKKAAAQVQAQRAGKDIVVVSATTPPEEEASMPPPSGFKFPSTTIEPPSTPSNGFNKSHNRSRSTTSQSSPQKSYQFPSGAKSPSSSTNSENLTVPSVHERRQSGHYRSNSRNHDSNFQQNVNLNWRKQQSPSRASVDFNGDNQQPFIPGHRSRNSNIGGSISSISNFQLQQGQVGGRKSLFAPYLPQSSIPDLVAEGRLVVGTLRVNKKNRSDAYVATDGLLDADIFICGSKDRNRALEGDLVAVELLDVDEVWSSKREKEEKKRRKDNSGGNSNNNNNLQSSNSSESSPIDDVHNDASTHSSSGSILTNSTQNSSTASDDRPSLQRRGSLKQRPTLKKNDDVEVEGQSLLLVEEEEISDEYKPLYAGHVVAVIDRIPGQLFAGTLGLLRPSQQTKADKESASGNNQQSHQNRPKIVWFKPTDKKVPLIAIPTEQAPRDFVENVDKYSGKLFVASIKRWPITSLHPFGTLISELGAINDPSIEVDAILRDNNFLCDEYLNEFGEEREDYELDEVNLDEEFSKRRDFTNEYVLAISENGSSSDSALHVKRISVDRIELGVHISDVTEFIKEGSNLDKNARKRSTSVILAQKQVNLLPNYLIQYFSFEKNVKKLTLSVVFEIDTKDFKVDDVWIGESFIQPKVRLSYDEIDLILKDQLVGNDEISSASKDYIKTISLISREFRRERLDSDSLNNETNLTLLDQIDDERVRLDLNLFKTPLSSSVLNEINLKVNNFVAQRTFSILGDEAFLRRLSVPTSTKLEIFAKKCLNFGVEIDVSSHSNLVNSILNVEDPLKRQCIEILLNKILQRGKYFVGGESNQSLTNNNGAWFFNLPIYTHFTSPLRRYADFIVHRQLKSTLSISATTSDDVPDSIKTNIEKKSTDLEWLKMTAEYCNFKKDCAKNSQDQSIHLLLSKVLNSMSKSAGQLIVYGWVLQVYESSFDVYIPEFGIEKRVHGDQLPLKKCEFNNKSSTLELYWEKGVDSATYIPDDEKEPLSYRNSIKNKFKTNSKDIVKYLSQERLENINDDDADEIIAELTKLKLNKPKIELNEVEGVKLSLDNFFKGLKLRVGGINQDYYIQEVSTFDKVPILLRSEIGMALPCLTVHALNPFLNHE
ncbi:hypothetical protein WICMUC_004153 [Wickerhamomyces mucosus]|uniref:RNB domain-containing protein n=1 Tax=Wickerhamomyces mucosus TaxID=1378264 RepID=A0A9P8PK23_9ASCO|nr:hypothetical protein WICMUC_004153 [Wickerhamomyces mucosus]